MVNCSTQDNKPCFLFREGAPIVWPEQAVYHYPVNVCLGVLCLGWQNVVQVASDNIRVKHDLITFPLLPSRNEAKPKLVADSLASNRQAVIRLH